MKGCANRISGPAFWLSALMPGMYPADRELTKDTISQQSRREKWRETGGSAVSPQRFAVPG